MPRLLKERERLLPCQSILCRDEFFSLQEDLSQRRVFRYVNARGGGRVGGVRAEIFFKKRKQKKENKETRRTQRTIVA